MRKLGRCRHWSISQRSWAEVGAGDLGLEGGKGRNSMGVEGGEDIQTMM